MKNLTKINIVTALRDEKLFGRDLSTRSAHLALLKSIYALQMSEEELTVFRQCTGRVDPPSEVSREVYLICGRRSGKTEIAAEIAAFESVFANYQRDSSTGERLYCLLISPTRKQSSVAMDYLRNIFSGPILKSLVEKEIQDTIYLKNNTAVTVLASDFRSIRGFGSHCVIIDEASFFSVEGQRPAEEIVRSVRPMLIASGGKLISISTPYSKTGIMYEAFTNFYSMDGPVLVWQACSTLINPTLDESLIEREQEKDPEGSRAEWFGEFRTDITSFLDMERIESCIHPYTEHPPRQDIRYQAFVDSSGGRKDAYVTCVGHYAGSLSMPYGPESPPLTL